MGEKIKTDVDRQLLVQKDRKKFNFSKIIKLSSDRQLKDLGSIPSAIESVFFSTERFKNSLNLNLISAKSMENIFVLSKPKVVYLPPFYLLSRFLNFEIRIPCILDTNM